MNATLFQPVMLALVASIHVLSTARRRGRRGWPGQARPWRQTSCSWVPGSSAARLPRN